MSVPYLRVKNWERFQHYGGRRPPWIKLHVEVLDDYEFERLPDASKAHLTYIWVLASKLGGLIPDDPHWVARKMSATVPVDLETLIDAGFLERETDAITALPLARADAPSQEAEAETEEERTLAPAPRPRDEVWDTLVDLLGFTPADKTSAHGAFNKAVKDLKAHGATADSIRAAAKAYAKAWPGVRLTAPALAKHYPDLEASAPTPAKAADRAEAFVRNVGRQLPPPALADELSRFELADADRDRLLELHRTLVEAA